MIVYVRDLFHWRVYKKFPHVWRFQFVHRKLCSLWGRLFGMLHGWVISRLVSPCAPVSLFVTLDYPFILGWFIQFKGCKNRSAEKKVVRGNHFCCNGTPKISIGILVWPKQDSSLKLFTKTLPKAPVLYATTALVLSPPEPERPLPVGPTAPVGYYSV